MPAPQRSSTRGSSRRSSIYQVLTPTPRRSVHRQRKCSRGLTASAPTAICVPKTQRHLAQEAAMPAYIIACVEMHDRARCDQEYITNGSSIPTVSFGITYAVVCTY